jgi:hypothetical protein
MGDELPDSFEPALRALCSWWREEHIPAVMIGGFAVSMVAAPRATQDLDALVLVPDEVWPALIESAARFGLVPRATDPLSFAQQTRMLLLRDERSGVEIDISLGIPGLEEDIVQRAIAMPILGETIPVADPTSLLIMKIVAGRPRDMIDAQTILAQNPDLDRERVESWVRTFTEELGESEYVDRLKRVWAEAGLPEQTTASLNESRAE